MKILVFSDSHGVRDKMDSAIREHLKYGKIDKIFFLGDGYHDIQAVIRTYPELDFDYVFGNCDDFSIPREERTKEAYEKIVEVGGIRFMLMHGHKYSVKETYQFAADHAIEMGCDVLLYGHTHLSNDITIDGSNHGCVRMINPGAAGRWYGASYALLDIVGRDVVCGFGDFS